MRHTRNEIPPDTGDLVVDAKAMRDYLQKEIKFHEARRDQALKRGAKADRTSEESQQKLHDLKLGLRMTEAIIDTFTNLKG